MFGSRPAQVPQNDIDKDGNRSVGWGNNTNLWFHDEAEAAAAEAAAKDVPPAPQVPTAATATPVGAAAVQPQGLARLSTALSRVFGK